MLKQRISARQQSSKRDLRVNLYRDKKPVTCRVARLVALAWCKGYAEGMQVNHKDGNTLNNKASNLEWVTGQDNEAHALTNGLIPANPIALMHNGSCVCYASQIEASKALGRCGDYVTSRLRKEHWTAVAADGKEYAIVMIAGKRRTA